MLHAVPVRYRTAPYSRTGIGQNVTCTRLCVYPVSMRVPVFSVGMRFSVNLLTGKPKMADIGPTCCSGICGVCVCGGGGRT